MGELAPGSVGLDDYGVSFAGAHDLVFHYVAAEKHSPGRFFSALAAPLRATHFYRSFQTIRRRQAVPVASGDDGIAI